MFRSLQLKSHHGQAKGDCWEPEMHRTSGPCPKNAMGLARRALATIHGQMPCTADTAIRGWYPNYTIWPGLPEITTVLLAQLPASSNGGYHQLQVIAPTGK
jgi:hypothetical protein